MDDGEKGRMRMEQRMRDHEARSGRSGWMPKADELVRLMDAAGRDCSAETKGKAPETHQRRPPHHAKAKVFLKYSTFHHLLPVQSGGRI